MLAHLRTEAYPIYRQPVYPLLTEPLSYDANLRRIAAAKKTLLAE
jgi:hypothetical protein